MKFIWYALFLVEVCWGKPGPQIPRDLNLLNENVKWLTKSVHDLIGSQRHLVGRIGKLEQDMMQQKQEPTEQDRKLSLLTGEVQKLKDKVQMNQKKLGQSLAAPQPKIAFHVKMEGESRESGNVEFRTIELNVGNGWDQFAHQFRPPIAGLYVFHLVGYPISRSADSRLFIMHEGKRIQYIHFGHDQHDSTSANVVLHLVAGVHVYVTMEAGTIYGGGWTHFTGYLLAADSPRH